MSTLKVLLIGGGGREHALARKLRESPRLGKLFVAPGNAGTSSIATNVPIKATDVDALLAFALKEKIDLTIVGQDDPLALGIVNVFQAHGLKIFGPTALAARIEASKIFSKMLMQDVCIRTAAFKCFNDANNAIDFVRHWFSVPKPSPIFVKASGLALGKGAVGCKTLEEAEQAIDDIMVKRVYGTAGDQIVIEAFVPGQEISTHAFCDGNSHSLFPTAQDHKPIYDGGLGPNTGGMGTIAPVPWFNQMDEVSRNIVSPILNGLQKIGCPFVGCLYPGLMVQEPDINVLEFNARFGDPETQVFMRLLDTDLLEIFLACVEGRLHEIDVKWKPGFAACIVMASEGYPSTNYKKGVQIHGVESAEMLPNVVVYHAGTSKVDGVLKTSGGRVLGVTCTGPTLQEALNGAYAGVHRIHFDGAQYRKDIGAKSLMLAPTSSV